MRLLRVLPRLAVSSFAAVSLVAAGSALAASATERPKKLALERLDVKPLAIVGATIHPVTSEPIAGGTLLLDGGKIRAILRPGARVPEHFEQIDARGLHAYPGLIAASADGLGLGPDAFTGGADAIVSRPVADSFDPFASDVELASSGGITCALVWVNAFQPKGAFQGRAALLKMSAREPRGVVLRDPAALRASPALLSPGTRHELEQALRKARQGSRAARGRASGDLDAFQELAHRRIPLVANPGNPGAILAMAELADLLDLRLVLSLSGDAWQVADRLHATGAAAIQHVRPSWGTARGDRRANLPGGWRPDAPLLLTRAGLDTAICPLNDSIRVWGVGGRDLLDLPMEAAFAQRSGLSADEALAAITIVPARIFGVEDRIGSLEVGKDADVILADGDLLDYRTFVRKTIVNGRVAYDAATSRHWKNVVKLRDGANAE